MDKNKLSGQLLFAKEASEYLGITVQRLNKLVQEGKVKPLKKNNSGTIFLIDDLNQRKEELSIFTKVVQGGGESVFSIDTKEKQEALNFATLMNVLKITEGKLEPEFDKFSGIVKVEVALEDEAVLEKYVDFFKVNQDALLKEYIKAKEAFSALKKTDEIIKRGSRDYPPLLAKTEQAPRFLYVRGKKSLLYESRTVALVGSRNASEKAQETTRRLAKKLGENGITVISGLAKGIDVSAHKSALENSFNTIAVIGTNLNQYYPSENKLVQLEIENKGLVVSQFSPASKTQRWFFPLRNGVMSGLSLATVIVEAGETSGALKQADFALKQGRQVIIPRSALEIEKITWPEKYLARGAILAERPSEVLRILADNKIFKISNQTEQQSQQKISDLLNSTYVKGENPTSKGWVDSIIIEE